VELLKYLESLLYHGLDLGLLLSFLFKYLSAVQLLASEISSALTLTHRGSEYLPPSVMNQIFSF